MAAVETPDKRNAFILAHIRLAKAAANAAWRRIPAGVMSQDDAIAEGLAQLVKIAGRSDPANGGKTTLVYRRVFGSVIDAARRLDDTPRRVRAIFHKVAEIKADYLNRLHREPTEAETAEALGFTVKRLRKFLRKCSMVSIVSGDIQFEGDGDTLFETLCCESTPKPGEEMQTRETHAKVSEIMANLSEQERFVLDLYYFKGYKFHQIAKEMGLTESRVCQIRQSAVVNLRRKFFLPSAA